MLCFLQDSSICSSLCLHWTHYLLIQWTFLPAEPNSHSKVTSGQVSISVRLQCKNHFVQIKSRKSTDAFHCWDWWTSSLIHWTVLLMVWGNAKQKTELWKMIQTYRCTFNNPPELVTTKKGMFPWKAQGAAWPAELLEHFASFLGKPSSAVPCCY